MVEMGLPERQGSGGVKRTKIMPDETPKETAQKIDMAAAVWVAKLDRGNLSEAEQNELDAWLAADSRRVGAFAKAKAVAIYSERAMALGANLDLDDFDNLLAESGHGPKDARPAMISRRRLLWGGSAMAAGLAAAVTAGLVLTSRGKEYSTQRGQMKVIPLSDGSVISLNTESRIRVAYSEERRTIHLEEGEALFDVAKDALRPFLVLAGDSQVVATGTSFVVRHLTDTPVEVLVREGSVEINQRSKPAAVLRLSENMRAVARTDPAHKAGATSAIAVSADEVKRAMAWRDGRIAFEGQTLREAAEEFHRYSDIRIIIDDPNVANQAVTGLFQVNDPIGFAKAVATSFGLHAEVSDKQVRLYQ